MPNNDLRTIARRIVGAPKAGRPKPAASAPSSVRGVVSSVDANGQPWITVGGSDSIFQAVLSHPPTGLKPGDVVDVQTHGTKMTVTGRAMPDIASGLTPFPTYSGKYNPNGVQAGNVGDTYLEESATKPSIWRKSTAGGKTGWISMGGTIRYSQTFSVQGALGSGYFPPFFVPVPSSQLVTLVGFRCMSLHGAGTVNLLSNGTAFASTLSCDTTPVTYSFDLSVADNDYFGIEFNTLIATGVLGRRSAAPERFGATGIIWEHFSGSFFFDVTS